LSDGHQGKRVAMHSGFGVIKTELVVCIDSDTVLDRSAVEEMVKPFLNPKVGCATGNITVINRKENLLTWLTDMRYWLAFNFERAAQSAVGVMSCVSGPLGCYRMDLINLIKDDWVNQTFLGRKCTYGDDRHLTNLILSLGYMSVYVKNATARTQAPADLKVWLNQQLRWSRSFNREYLVNMLWFYKHNLWLAFDMTYQAVFPLLLTINILFLIVASVTKSPWYLLVWLSLVLVFGFMRSLYAVIFTKRPEFFAFTLYSLLYVVFLLPLKWIALFTIKNTDWGTR
jgi:hyaluronan synthase